MGTYDIVISKGSVSNYNVTYVKGTLTVKQSTLTASVGDYSRKQGESNPSFKIAYSGFKYGETEDVLTSKAKATCTATSSSAPGTYPITLSGAAAKNYTIAYRNGTLTVTQADAIVVSAKSYTITYGDALPQFAYEVSGGALNGRPTITCSAGTKPSVGTYDIVISKGSVSNYNVAYVKGTLTVEKTELIAKVNDYIKYEGEDNPVFGISYQGFKYGETESVLTHKPQASCEANKYSPSASYPITLYGGESQNYSFKYIDGTLTIKHVYKMLVSSLSHGKVKYNNTFVNDFTQFEVREGEPVTLMFYPDEGYHLDELVQNGQDVTKKVLNNCYTIDNMNQDLNIIVSFSINSGSFVIDDIYYDILSAPDRTVRVIKETYSGHVIIPSRVIWEGNTWDVKGVAANAFNNCSELISISFPSSLNKEDVGISLFTGCIQLAAITWNADFGMSNEMLGAIDNPNLLFYVSQKDHAPSSATNIVVNGKADIIKLQDVVDGSGNFYCPKAFTATNISYTHNYSMESAIGDIAGWETIALPFTVQKIEHNSKGVLTPFAKYNASQATQRPFWLYTYSNTGFVKASEIKANTPYIICMPNNVEYDEEYILAGKVTFSAQNATIEVSSNLKTAKKGDKTFTPAFCQQNKSSNMYVLNVKNDKYSETGSRNPGSTFISNLRNISPFEAYMATSVASAPMMMPITFEDETGINDLTNIFSKNSHLRIYNMVGQMIQQCHSQEELQTVIQELKEGIYIINGKKVYIK